MKYENTIINSIIDYGDGGNKSVLENYPNYNYTPEDNDVVKVCLSREVALDEMRDCPLFSGVVSEVYAGKFPKEYLTESTEQGDYSFFGYKSGDVRRFYLYPETI